MRTLLLLLFLALPGWAWGQTPRTVTLDGILDFTSFENLGTKDGRIGYVTWDATNIYIGLSENPLVGTNSNMWVVFDSDPVRNASPRTGNGLNSQPVNESGVAAYPFNADIAFRFWGTGSNDGSAVNPAPGLRYSNNSTIWSSADISSGVQIIRHNVITEISIPFSEIGITSGSAFNLLFYVANNTEGGSVFGSFPVQNATGNAPALRFFYEFNRDNDISPNQAQYLALNNFPASIVTLSNNTSIGNVYTNNGVNFGTGSQVLRGLTILAGGFVEINRPSYSVGSILRYNTGGSYGIGSEWPVGTSVVQNVEISTSTLNIGSGSRTVQGSLTIGSGGTLDIAAGSSVIVSGAYSFPSMASVTGGGNLNLTPSRTTSQISGATLASGWRLVGPPVSGMKVTDLASSNLVQGVTDLFASSNPNLFKHTSGNSYTDITSNEDLTQGRGYLWYMFANTVVAAGESWKALPANLNATGNVLRDNLTISNYTGLNSGGFNYFLLSNPYPVPFCVGALSAGFTVNGALVWNPTGEPTSENPAGVGTWTPTILPSEYIQPWQGFFVSNNLTSNTSFTFNVSGTSNTCPPLGKVSVDRVRADFSLTGLVNGVEIVDRSASLIFDGSLEVGESAYQVAKMTPLMNRFATIAIGGDSFGENGLASYGLPLHFEEVIQLPLRLNATVSGTFALNMSSLNDLPSSIALVLEDRVTGERHNLRMNPVITFTTGVTHTDRFLLTIDPTGTATNAEGVELPSAFVLSAPAPNPFRGATTLDLRVETAQTVTATLYDVLGREVAQLFHGDVAPGQVQQFRVNGETLNAGVYFVRVDGQTFTETRRLVRIQ